MSQPGSDRDRAGKSPRRVQGERRVITMLFCDVTGSTAMAEDLDPEEWAEIMNEAFEYMVAPIYRYEGTVARIMGDGILAFFGAPLAHEDDPQRAVLAGLDIIHGLRPFCEDIREDYGLEFNVRVGINTGPVVVGEMGADQALEYTAMGDAINLASRMETSAAPGTVQIAADTFKLVGPLFDVEPLGVIAVKGKDEPVEAYRVLGRKERPGRLRGIPGLDAALVGRSDELKQLGDIIGRLQAGQGQVIFLIGEAGIGKSRLIEELRAEWKRGNSLSYSWTESQGLPYENDRPYTLFHQRLQSILGILANDSPDIIKEKIAAGLATLPADYRPSWGRAAEILLAVEAASDEPALEAEALKRQLFDALYEAWQRISAEGPTVAVFDDLHWCDPASAELLIYLMRLVDQVPLLILCAMRPVRESAGWQVKETVRELYPDHFQELILEPLSDDESDELVSNLLTIADLPPKMRRLILRKAEGNPFFVEEVVRSLIEVGAVERDATGMHWRATGHLDDIAIPDSLQALLISRIDRLEGEAKQTLQLASVIGRSFYRRLLQQIADRIRNLSKELNTLQQVELIRESATAPELEYIFRHELTRDATYQTILRRQLRRYHRRVGEAIEKLFPERLADEAHRLAYHFREAGDSERALIYYTKAGDQAARLFANAEAIDYFDQAIRYAREIGSSEQIVYLYIKKGRVHEVSGQYDEAMALYQELQALAKDREEPDLELKALVAQATLRSTYTDKFEPEQAQALSESALTLARALNDHQAQAKIYWNMMLNIIYSGGDASEAIQLGEQSLAIAREHDLKEQVAYTLHDLTRAYVMAGDFKQGLNLLQEAGELFEASGNLPMLADNRATLAYGLSFLGKFEAGSRAAGEALAISRRIGSLWGQAYANSAQAHLLFQLGRVDEALNAWQQAVILAEQANFFGSQLFARAYQGLAFAYLGDTRRGLALCQEALAKLVELNQPQNRIDVLIPMALIYVWADDLAAADKVIEELRSSANLLSLLPQGYPLFVYAEATLGFLRGEYQQVAETLETTMSWMDKKGQKHYRASLGHLLGRALLALGKVDEAWEILDEALKLAVDTGSQIDRWPILATLGEIAMARGDATTANAYWEQAQAVITTIGDHIGDPVLHKTFLNLPEVREIIEKV